MTDHSEKLGLLTQLAKLARTDVHAIRVINNATSPPRPEYRPVPTEVSEEVLLRHLANKTNIAFYLMTPGTSVTHLAVLDLDDHARELSWKEIKKTAAKIIKKANRQGLNAWTIRSGGGQGIHIWFRWDEPQSAADVRRLLSALLESLGFKNGTKGIAAREIEIFPKQNEVSSEGMGSLIAAPFARESIPLGVDLDPVERPSPWLAAKPVAALITKFRQQSKILEEKRALPTAIELATVVDALKYVEAETYEIWFRVGMALKSAFGDDGFLAWDAWSQGSSKYNASEVCKKWKSFKRRATGGVTIASIFSLARENGWINPTKPVDGRLEVVYDPTNPMQMAREIETSLLRGARDVYQQGGVLIRIVRLEENLRGKGFEFEAGALILSPVTPTWLTGRAMELIRWIRPKKDGFVPVILSKSVAETYLEMKNEWAFSRLVGTVETPTLYRKDGDFILLQESGYDEASGLYFDSNGVDFPAVAAHPTRDDALAALEQFCKLLSGFPFVPDELTENWAPAPDEGSRPSRARSVVLSAWLTGLMRRTLKAAPMHAFDAVSPGTGKSLLVRILCLVLYGREASPMPWVGSEEEQRKRIMSALMAGRQVLFFDNIDDSMGGRTLNTALTEPLIEDRVLGKSQNIECRTNCMVFAAGNNLSFTADTTRRTVLCQLDAREERPEARVFELDPIAEIAKHRAEYVVAGLTILLAYIEAGRPSKGQVRRVGSYEDWSIVQEALVWLDQPDPAITMMDVAADDPTLEAKRQVMDVWWECYGNCEMTLQDVLADIDVGSDRALQFNGDQIIQLKRRLFEAFAAGVSAGRPQGRSIPVNNVSIGYWIKKHAGQIHDDRRFQRAGDKHGRRIALIKKGAAPQGGRLATAALSVEELSGIEHDPERYTRANDPPM